MNTYHLMTMEEFADLVTIAEMTPGPISLNAATFVGNHVYGIPGAIVCTIACILPSFCICLFLSFLYYRFRSQKAMHILLESLRAAVIALITSAGLSILILSISKTNTFTANPANLNPIELLIFLGSFLLLRKWKLSPILIIFGSGILGVLLYSL